MKKTFLFLAICFSVIAVIAGCGGAASPAAPAAQTGINALAIVVTPTPALYIIGTVRKERVLNAMRTPTVSDYYMVDISDNNTPVTTAVIKVNSTVVPYISNTGIYGRYRKANMTVNTNASYVISVSYKNLTYSATCKVPGGQSLSSDALRLSWLYPGNTRTLKIIGPSSRYGAGTTTLAASPYSIPASAYPTAGTYDVVALFQKSSVFSGDPRFIVSAIANADDYCKYTVIK